MGTLSLLGSGPSAIIYSGGGGGGGACAMGSAYADGCSAAPAGTPQYPTILNGYGSGGIRAANGNQPPWNVAGVDYATGIDRTLYPTTGDLKIPGVGSPTGLTLWAGGPQWSWAGGSLDGYHFVNNVIVPGGSSNTTLITNCFFDSANVLMYGSTNNMTVKYCELSGSDYAAVYTGGGASGSLTVQYNYMHNGNQHAVSIEGVVTVNNLDYRFNLVENFATDPTAHLNYLQTLESYAATELVTFNTFKQILIGAGGEGLQNYDFNPNTQTWDNNTIITQLDSGGNSCISNFFNAQKINAVGTISNNYIDRTGIKASDGFHVFYGTAVSAGLATLNNVDMVSGAIHNLPDW